MTHINKQYRGKQAEHHACQFLQQQGLVLLRQNYRWRYGEIDLIMLDQQTLVFVEVRSHHSRSHGHALESVQRFKARKLILTAQHFLQSQFTASPYSGRSDIIAIHYIAGKMQLDWIKNAFTTDEYG